MNRQMLRSKLHRISVTECNVEYEGSLTLDPDLMREVGMVPYERIDVYDVDNANRFSTYLIEGKPGSGDCCVNGAAAHLVGMGDKLILASYCVVEDKDVATHQPQIVIVGEGNRIKETKRGEGARVRI